MGEENHPPQQARRRLADCAVCFGRNTERAAARLTRAARRPTDASYMIRAFLFDIGNVLLRFDFSLALAKLAAQSEVHDPTEMLAAIDRIKLAYEDGQIDRAGFLRGAFDVLRYR